MLLVLCLSFARIVCLVRCGPQGYVVRIICTQYISDILLHAMSVGVFLAASRLVGLVHLFPLGQRVAIPRNDRRFGLGYLSQGDQRGFLVP